MPHEVDKLESLVKDFENFLSVTEEARTASEQDRDYVDHKQWTSTEVATLEARNQAPVVINRIKVKVNLLTGVQKLQRTDPKALPRTPKHEQAADAVTDAVRFVADNVDFEQDSSEVFTDYITWGYGGVITEVEQKGEDIEIAVNQILSDRLYFDPHSRRKDFKDAKFLGIVIWMDEDEAIATFPDKKDDIQTLLGGADVIDGSTFEDKPTWTDRKRRRIRVCQHYFMDGGEWFLTYFTSTTFLIEPRPSPYLDEFGKPSCPIEAETAYIDRDNNRYGEVRSYIWIQDEINHRRSRLLHNLSVRQTIGEEGAVDVNAAKQELAKANGHVVVTPNMRFEVLENNDVTNGQFQLYQESKAEIDSIGANAALSGEPDADLSGRAIQSLQRGGLAELKSLYDGHTAWEKRVYRQIWNRIKQFWDAERWIRVTDNEDNLKWVGLNQPITLGEQLQELAQEGDQRAQAALQQMLATQDARLNQVVDVRNNVAELDVDIILTESPDFVTRREEQFQILSQLAQAYGPEAVPFEVMLKLSDMPNREVVEELLNPDQELDPEQQAARQELLARQAKMQDAAAQLELRLKEADVDATKAKTAKDAADAVAQELENEAVQAGLQRLSNA